MRKLVVRLLVVTVLLIFLNGCSSKENNVVHSQNSGLYETYKKEQKRISIDYVNLSKDKSIVSILNDLSKITKRYYSFKGNNITIKGVPDFKARTFEEVNSFIKTMTSKELIITKNRLDKDLPQIVELIDQEPSTALDKTIVDSDNIINPAVLFKDLAKITGFRVVPNSESKKILNKDQEIWFKGTYRELLKLVALNHNMFLDIDTKLNTAKYETFKIKRIKLKMSSETQEYISKISVDLSDTEGTDSKSNTELVSKSNYKAMESLKSFLDDLFLEKDGSFYAKPIEATNEIVIKADPIRMKLVEDFVENLNADATRQVLLKVTLIEVNLNDRFDSGINWSFVDKWTSSAITLGTNSVVPSMDNTLTAPTILKVSNNKGLGGMLNLFKQFGDTTIGTAVPMITTNEIPALANVAKKKSYIEDWELKTEGDDSYLAPRQNKENYGTYVYLKPSIYDNEVRLSFKMIDAPIPNLTKEIFEDGRYLQTVDTDKRIFSQNFIMKPGERIIIGGFIRTLNDKEYSGSYPDQNSLVASLFGVKGKNIQKQELILQIEMEEF